MPARPTIEKDVLSTDYLEHLRKLVCAEIKYIYADYYKSQMTFERFIINKMFPDSHDMFLLQFRIMSLIEFGKLINMRLLKIVYDRVGPMCVSNMFFVRFADPRATSDGARRKIENITFSPLHYDNYGGTDHVSAWIPLCEIDEGTGGLCWATTEQLIQAHGGTIGPTEYHRDDSPYSGSYLEGLASGIETVNCSCGDVVVFDRTLLHGSTYALEKPRFSVDIRFMSTKSVEKSRSDGALPKDLSFCHLFGMDAFFRKNTILKLQGVNDLAFLRRNGFL